MVRLYEALRFALPDLRAYVFRYMATVSFKEMSFREYNLCKPTTRLYYIRLKSKGRISGQFRKLCCTRQSLNVAKSAADIERIRRTRLILKCFTSRSGTFEQGENYGD